MRSKRLLCTLGVLVTVAGFGTVAAQEVGEVIPWNDPSDEPFAVITPFLPGPVEPMEEPPSVPTPLTEQEDLLNVTPEASETGAHDSMQAIDGGAVFSGRGGGRGTTPMQRARRSLKQLIRQLG